MSSLIISLFLLLPLCVFSLVEYETPEEAQRAIRELNDRTLYGRQVFLREDREDEARYGAAAITPIGRGSRLPPTSRPVAPPSGENPHIFISGVNSSSFFSSDLHSCETDYWFSGSSLRTSGGKSSKTCSNRPATLFEPTSSTVEMDSRMEWAPSRTSILMKHKSRSVRLASSFSHLDDQA